MKTVTAPMPVKPVHAGAVRGFLDAELVGAWPAHPDVLADLAGAEVLKRTRRTRVVAVALDGRSLVVKRHAPRGILARLATIFRTSRAMRAYVAARALAALGVRTPTPLGAFEERRLKVLRASWLVVPRVVPAETLQERKEPVPAAAAVPAVASPARSEMPSGPEGEGARGETAGARGRLFSDGSVEELRKAIILKEVLGPPLALRDEER